MKENGIVIVGAEAGLGGNIWEIDLNIPVAVVIGSEGKGIRKTVKDDCDIIFTIPMRGKINSLNVSVATGIIVFEIIRQRMKKIII